MQFPIGSDNIFAFLIDLPLPTKNTNRAMILLHFKVIKINKNGGRFLRELPTKVRELDSGHYFNKLPTEASRNDAIGSSFKIFTAGGFLPLFVVGMILVWHKRRASH